MNNGYHLCFILSDLLIIIALASSCSEKPTNPDPPHHQPSWSAIESPTNYDLNDAWGASDDFIFAVGTHGTIAHFNGTKWETTDTGWNNFSGVWGFSSSSVYAIGHDNLTAAYFDGKEWATFTALDRLRSVWGSAGNAVYAVGSHGVIVSFDGEKWIQKTAPVPRDLYGVWGSEENNVFIVGELGLILNSNGTTWNQMSSEIFQYMPVADEATVSYYDLSDRYEVNRTLCQVHGSQLESNFLFEYDLGELSLVEAVAITSAEINIAYVRDITFGLCDNLPMYFYLNTADGVIEAGEMRTGTYCCEIPCNSALSGIANVNVLDALRAAVNGSKDYIGFNINASDYHGLAFPSCAPSMIVSTQPCLKSIWGTSNDNVYVVGTNGTILNYNGLTWTRMNSGTIYDLNDIWGFSASDIFAVGANGTITHYDGHSWTRMDSGTTKNLNSVWGMWPTNVYAFGEDGVIIRYY